METFKITYERRREKVTGVVRLTWVESTQITVSADSTAEAIPLAKAAIDELALEENASSPKLIRWEVI